MKEQNVDGGPIPGNLHSFPPKISGIVKLPYERTQSIPQNLEKEMAPHSSTLAWKIPWTEESDRLQSMGSQRVRHD